MRKGKKGRKGRRRGRDGRGCDKRDPLPALKRMVQKAADEVKRREEERIQVPGKGLFRREGPWLIIQYPPLFRSGLSSERARPHARVSPQLDVLDGLQAPVVRGGEGELEYSRLSIWRACDTQ